LRERRRTPAPERRYGASFASGAERGFSASVHANAEPHQEGRSLPLRRADRRLPCQSL